MAKKKVKQTLKCEPCADFKPRMYVSLEGQDVAQIKTLQVGDEVELKVTGKVVGLSQRERPDYNDSSKTKKTGDIDLEDYRVEVLEDEKNEFSNMADEEADE